MTNGGPTGELASRLFLAVRIGDIVLVLGKDGYEFAVADPPVFHEVGRRAVQRLTAWMRRR